MDTKEKGSQTNTEVEKDKLSPKAKGKRMIDSARHPGTILSEKTYEGDEIFSPDVGHDPLGQAVKE